MNSHFMVVPIMKAAVVRIKLVMYTAIETIITVIAKIKGCK